MAVLRRPPVLSGVALVLAVLGVGSFWYNAVGGVIGIIAAVLAVLALHLAKQSSDSEPIPTAVATAALTVGSLAAGLAIALLSFGTALGNAFDDALDESDTDNVGSFNSDPADGRCDSSRFIQDPDC